MRSVKIEELTLESFKPFGTFVNMINPDTEAIGGKPVQFFRDMAPLMLVHPRSLPSFSICRVEKRPLVVDVTEMHSYTAEGNIPPNRGWNSSPETILDRIMDIRGHFRQKPDAFMKRAFPLPFSVFRPKPSLQFVYFNKTNIHLRNR